MANEYFFPPIEPFETGILDVGEPHRLYWEQCGNPQGDPVLFLHGGPGAGCTEFDRCFFNPQHFRIVLFDQRGSGRSRPVGDLSNNTMADTARDIEQLQQIIIPLLCVNIEQQRSRSIARISCVNTPASQSP